MHPHLADGTRRHHRSPIRRSDPRHLGAKSWRTWRVAPVCQPQQCNAMQCNAMQGPGPPLFNHLHERMLRALQNSFRPTGMEWNTGSGCTLHCTAKNTMQARDSLWVSTAVLHGIGMHGVDQRIHGHFISSRSR
jgi:hypothetical protein